MDKDLGQAFRVGRKSFAQDGHVGNALRGQVLVEDSCEFRFAAAVMSKPKQIDHHMACGLLAVLLKQPVEALAIRRTREEFVAVYKAHERHGFAPERMDDVMIIDHLAVLPIGLGVTARGGHYLCRADKHIEASIVQARRK